MRWGVFLLLYLLRARLPPARQRFTYSRRDARANSLTRPEAPGAFRSISFWSRTMVLAYNFTSQLPILQFFRASKSRLSTFNWLRSSIRGGSLNFFTCGTDVPFLYYSMSPKRTRKKSAGALTSTSPSTATSCGSERKNLPNTSPRFACASAMAERPIRSRRNIGRSCGISCALTQAGSRSTTSGIVTFRMQNSRGRFAAEYLGITVSDSCCVKTAIFPDSLLSSISKRTAPW
jgi:hypothetical protein